jgi:hypothetical protein
VTIDLETRLRTGLMAEADTAPPTGGLLGEVHARARQRSRRRVALAGVAAIAAVAVAATAASLLPGGRDALRGPDQVATGSDGPLVAGPQPRLVFPLTPTWLPDGLESAPHISLGQSGLLASYRDAAKGPDGDLLGVDIWSSDHDVTTTGDGVTRHATTFDGHPAVLATMQGAVSLGWQPTPGAWLAVTASNSWATEQIARKVAASLTSEPLYARSPFQLGLVPRDSELADWTTDGRLVFVPQGQMARWYSGPEVKDAVQIAVRRATADLTGHGDPVTVQGRPGWLLTESTGRKTLVVQLTDAIVLVVDAPPWDDKDVLRLAEATHYSGGLPPAEG